MLYANKNISGPGLNWLSEFLFLSVELSAIQRGHGDLAFHAGLTKTQFYCRNMWFSDEEGPPKHVRARTPVCGAVWGNDKSSGFKGD